MGTSGDLSVVGQIPTVVVGLSINILCFLRLRRLNNRKARTAWQMFRIRINSYTSDLWWEKDQNHDIKQIHYDVPNR